MAAPHTRGHTVHVSQVFIDPRFDADYAADPLVLADIGARGGLRPNWRAARRHLRLIGFEPDKTEYARLVEQAAADGSGDRFFPVALHNQRGSVALHVARDRGLSSIFEPNRSFLRSFPECERFDTIDRRTIETDTLDHVLDAEGVSSVDFVKVDTQGSELFVLQGASRTLSSSVVGVEAEVEFTPIYVDQPLFADVDALLRGTGYLLFDLRPCYWKRAIGVASGGPHGEIIWADALYLRSVASLREMITGLDVGQRRRKVLKAISIVLLYGYVDYALEIADALADLWSADERTTIRARLLAFGRSPGRTAPLPRRRRLAAAWRELWKDGATNDRAWSISEAELGNLD